MYYVMQGLNVRRKNKVAAVGTASLNLADLASADDQKDFDLNIPFTLPGGSVEPSPVLCVCISSLTPMRMSRAVRQEERQRMCARRIPVLSGIWCVSIPPWRA